jgi:uncharacterized protein
MKPSPPGRSAFWLNLWIRAGEGHMYELVKKWLENWCLQDEKQEATCLCCGECCESFGGHLNASRTDLERWRQTGREDLISRVNRLGWIWINPQTGEQEERCPFITRTGPETAICGIQDTKPDMCRDYPTLAHGRHCLRGWFLKIWIAAVVGAPCGFDNLADSFMGF